MARGFTLIELLVVIAIIGTVSSIVTISVVLTRNKAYDAQRKAEFSTIKTALNEFYLTYNRYPKNYNCNTTFCPEGNGGFGACDAPADTVIGSGTTNLVPSAFAASMQELVTAGFLSRVPKSPPGEGYCYYDFGPNTEAGALIVTALESSKPTRFAVPPSCRPFSSIDQTWCDAGNSIEYCLCNPY